MRILSRKMLSLAGAAMTAHAGPAVSAGWTVLGSAKRGVAPGDVMVSGRLAGEGSGPSVGADRVRTAGETDPRRGILPEPGTVAPGSECRFRAEGLVN